MTPLRQRMIEDMQIRNLSPHSRIAVSWVRRGSQVQLRVTVPANTRATVEIPVELSGMVTEGGLPLARAPGLEVVRRNETTLVVQVGSGTYDFVAQ